MFKQKFFGYLPALKMLDLVLGCCRVRSKNWHFSIVRVCCAQLHKYSEKNLAIGYFQWILKSNLTKDNLFWSSRTPEPSFRKLKNIFSLYQAQILFWETQKRNVSVKFFNLLNIAYAKIFYISFCSSRLHIKSIKNNFWKFFCNPFESNT